VTARPFTLDRRFRNTWWVGTAKGAVEFCSFTAPDLGEVARAQVKLGSTLGEAYPTYTPPRHGSTEIDLLEVRPDLQRRGFGSDAVRLLLVEFPGPHIAASLDAQSDRFWLSLAWKRHDHPNERGSALFVHPH